MHELSCIVNALTQMLAYIYSGLQKGMNANSIRREEDGEELERSTVIRETRWQTENLRVDPLLLRQAGLTSEQGDETRGRNRLCEQMTCCARNCVRQQQTAVLRSPPHTLRLPAAAQFVPFAAAQAKKATMLLPGQKTFLTMKILNKHELT